MNKSRVKQLKLEASIFWNKAPIPFRRKFAGFDTFFKNVKRQYKSKLSIVEIVERM